MTQAAATRSIVVQYDLAHPPAKVWRALTESKLVGSWLMENDLQPTVGHRFTFRAQPVPGWDGVLDRCAACGSTRLVKRLGEVSCRGCGAVDRVVAGPGAPERASSESRDDLAADVSAALDRVLRDR